jgi:hypothetical protein
MSHKGNDETAEQRRDALNDKYGDRAWLIPDIINALVQIMVAADCDNPFGPQNRAIKDIANDMLERIGKPDPK